MSQPPAFELAAVWRLEGAALLLPFVLALDALPSELDAACKAAGSDVGPE